MLLDCRSSQKNSNKVPFFLCFSKVFPDNELGVKVDSVCSFETKVLRIQAGLKHQSFQMRSFCPKVLSIDLFGIFMCHLTQKYLVALKKRQENRLKLWKKRLFRSFNCCIHFLGTFCFFSSFFLTSPSAVAPEEANLPWSRLEVSQDLAQASWPRHPEKHWNAE